MGGKHARLSPSNHRWPHCPGSVREEERYPDVPGDAAIDGTGSHELLNLCLTEGKRADEYIGQTIGEGHEDKPGGWTVDTERAKRVQMCLDYVERRVNELEGRSGVLEVIDYKDGRGWVDVKGNFQFISYVSGAVDLFEKQHMTKAVNVYSEIAVNPGKRFNRDDWFGTSDIVITAGTGPYTKIIMTVVQPKTNPVVRSWEIYAHQLQMEAGELATAAALTDDPDAPLAPGDHCTWCKHGRAGNCEAKNSIAVKGIEKMNISGLFENNLSVENMTNEQLAEIKDAEPLITKMLEQVSGEIFKRLKDGQEFENYGLGKGNSSKKWIDDEETVFKKLKGMRLKKEEIYVAKMISPAAALKHEGLTDRQKANLEKMFEVVPGKEKVVRKVHEKPTTEDMFGTKEMISFM